MAVKKKATGLIGALSGDMLGGSPASSGVANAAPVVEPSETVKQTILISEAELERLNRARRLLARDRGQLAYHDPNTLYRVTNNTVLREALLAWLDAKSV